jgi:hypothetical protein
MSLVVALSQQQAQMWEIAVGLGLVIILVVVTLLTLLARFVREIDQGVAGVWEVAQLVAANTAAGELLTGNLDGALVQVRDELLAHGQLLSDLESGA